MHVKKTNPNVHTLLHKLLQITFDRRRAESLSSNNRTKPMAKDEKIQRE